MSCFFKFVLDYKKETPTAMRNAVGGVFLYMINNLYKYNMKNSYLPKTKGLAPNGRGRPVDPNTWITGPDIVRRNKYYAFLKHRAQCKFRNEDYQLTFLDWENFWPDDKFQKRGRGRDCLLLTRKDISAGWTKENCFIQKRTDHLKRKREFLDNDRS